MGIVQRSGGDDSPFSNFPCFKVPCCHINARAHGTQTKTKEPAGVRRRRNVAKQTSLTTFLRGVFSKT
eukprot:scaffold34645_cov201-Amphora_coffeaeformis.AAC.6